MIWWPYVDTIENVCFDSCIWDLPLKFKPEALVLQHQLCFLGLSLLHLGLRYLRCHVVVLNLLVSIWCDLLNIRNQAHATFIFKWRGKKIAFLWNDDYELFITTSCAFYFLLVRKQWFVWIFGVVFKWIMIQEPSYLRLLTNVVIYMRKNCSSVDYLCRGENGLWIDIIFLSHLLWTNLFSLHSECSICLQLCFRHLGASCTISLDKIIRFKPRLLFFKANFAPSWLQRSVMAFPLSFLADLVSSSILKVELRDFFLDLVACSFLNFCIFFIFHNYWEMHEMIDCTFAPLMPVPS